MLLVSLDSQESRGIFLTDGITMECLGGDWKITADFHDTTGIIHVGDYDDCYKHYKTLLDAIVGSERACVDSKYVDGVPRIVSIYDGRAPVHSIDGLMRYRWSQ